MLLKEYYKFIPLLLFLLFSDFCRSQTIPPKIIAEGDQAYCHLGANTIVTDFDLVNPDGVEITALYIQISTGYNIGEDQLTLSNTSSHPDIHATWSSMEGKLTLESTKAGIDAQNDLIAAANDVVFESSSPNVSGEKLFSFTIGDANYLPSTDHYYQYISDPGITWEEARVAAENLTYYGRPGYLATITSSEEAKLSGEQAAGAGWIGGSDAETEGVWKWVTGPEAGRQFWNGGVNGNATAPDYYEFWNNSEPNNLGDEDYAHVTAPGIGVPGSWNDLPIAGDSNPSSDYHPKGYIVEFGVPGDPPLDISGSTRIYIPAINSVNDNSLCGPGEVTLSAEVSDISPLAEVLWFDSPTANTWVHKGENFKTPVLTTTRTYYVLASENGCTSGERIMVTATIYEIPVIEPQAILKNCDEDGVPDGYTNFNLEQANDFLTYGDSGLTVTYHLTNSEAETDMNAVIPSPFHSSAADNDLVYARVENSDGCFDIATVTLEVSTTSIPQETLVELSTCDMDNNNDGMYTFDLIKAKQEILNQLPDQNLSVKYYTNIGDAQLAENEILPQNDYRNETAWEQHLFVRVESDDNGDCYGIGEHLLLTVNPLPEFEVEASKTICLNINELVLNIENPNGDYTYTWLDENNNVISNESTATVTSGGNYTVVAASDLHCESFPKTVVVSASDIADINMEDISIVDNAENNSIAIEQSNLGIGDYEYALDNEFGPYQEEPLFEYVDPGLHTVYVKDKNYCGIAQLDVSIIGYPKFFTPNGDGINDTWQVNGVSAQPNSKIYIYDKFGKLLNQIDASGNGWDGVYKGKLLPSTDYWYMVQLEDGRIHKGHFSLITR